MNNPKPTIIFIRDTYNTPSSRYRWNQYSDYFSNFTIKTASYSPRFLLHYYNAIPVKRSLNRKLFQILLFIVGISRTLYFIIYDLLFYKSVNVIVIRRFFPRFIPPFGLLILKHYLKNKNVYWDFDDNIIADKEIVKAEAELLEQIAKKISVSNDFLKDTISSQYRNKVMLLPTTDLAFLKSDVGEFIKKREVSYPTNINICWLGTKGNLHFLDKVIPFLDLAATICQEKFNKLLTLEIVSNDKYYPKTTILEIKNTEWTYNMAIEVICNSHIGIMPLPNNEYTRGKAGFKAVQYISAGLPAIVDNVGFNREVIENGLNGFLIDEPVFWSESIINLSSNLDLWKTMSYNARQKWEKDFNPNRVINYWSAIMQH